MQQSPPSFAAALQQLRSEVDFGMEPEEWLPARDPWGGRDYTSDYAQFSSLQIIDPLKA